MKYPNFLPGCKNMEITGLYQQNPSIFADRSFCINKDINKKNKKINKLSFIPSIRLKM